MQRLIKTYQVEHEGKEATIEIRLHERNGHSYSYVVRFGQNSVLVTSPLYRSVADAHAFAESEAMTLLRGLSNGSN